MRDPALTVWTILSATKYFFLIVVCSIVGAYFGTAVGFGIAAVTGDPAWGAHARCAGWTLGVLIAAVGGPSGFVSFWNGKKESRDEPTAQPVEREQQPAEPKKLEGRGKSILVAPLIGALMGLILGGMASGWLVALYFFAALSPFGRGGWWPMLPLNFQASNDGFSTKDPFILIPWLSVMGLFVIAGILLGLFGTISWGQKHYRVFPSKQTQAQG